jgi:hypothetical protein
VTAPLCGTGRVIERGQSKDVKSKMRECKLRKFVYYQRPLKQTGLNKWGKKQGLHAPQTVTQFYFNGLY